MEPTHDQPTTEQGAEAQPAEPAKPIIKLTDADLHALIRSVAYSRFPADSTTTICAITLHSGFVVIGKSACLDPQNFDEHVGMSVACDNAVRQLWDLEGYRVKHAIYLTEHGAETVETMALLERKLAAAEQSLKDAHTIGHATSAAPSDTGDAAVTMRDGTVERFADCRFWTDEGALILRGADGSWSQIFAPDTWLGASAIRRETPPADDWASGQPLNSDATC